jgi:cell division protein FtsX
MYDKEDWIQKLEKTERNLKIISKVLFVLSFIAFMAMIFILAFIIKNLAEAGVPNVG